MKTLQILIALALTLVVCELHAADEKKSKPFKDVGVEEFDRLRANTNNVVLDVRTAKEYSEGHLPGAINIDVNSPEFAEKVCKLDKNKTYLVHCAAGRRSVKACEVLAKQDFKTLVNMEGGMNAWEKAGKPVEKK